METEEMVNLEPQLNYLTETKSLIKDAIINKGQNINDNDTFRSYVDKINNISSGDVKLFETVEEMQADTNSRENDLAVIYRKEIQNAKVDSIFSSATFPERVVLDTPIADYVDIRYIAVDESRRFAFNGNLDSSSFRIHCYAETTEIRIEYTSSDGITYIRTDDTGNPVDFGTEIYYERPEYWNDVIGKFIQIDGNIFEGLYKNSLIPVNLQAILLNEMSLTNGVVNIGTTLQIPDDIDIFDNKICEAANHIKTLEDQVSYSRHPFIVCIKDNILSVIAAGSAPSRPLLANTLFNNGTMLGLISCSHGSGYNFYEWQFNLTTMEYIQRNDITTTTSFKYDDYDDRDFTYNYTTYFNNYYFVGIIDWNYDDETFKFYHNMIYTTKSSSSDLLNSYNISEVVSNKYLIAPTQLTLQNPNELLPGKIAYGKNEVISGDGSIYTNLDNIALMSQILSTPIYTNTHGIRYTGELLNAVSNVKENTIQYLKQDDTGDLVVMTVDECIQNPNISYTLWIKGTHYYLANNVLYNISDNSIVKEFECAASNMIDDDTYLKIFIKDTYTIEICKTNLDDTEKVVLASYTLSVPIDKTDIFIFKLLNNCYMFTYNNSDFSNNIFSRIAGVYNLDTDKYTEMFNTVYTVDKIMEEGYSDDNKIFLHVGEIIKVYNALTDSIETEFSQSLTGYGIINNVIYKIGDNLYANITVKKIIDINAGILTEANTYIDEVLCDDTIFLQGEWLYYDDFSGVGNRNCHIAAVTLKNTSDIYITTDFSAMNDKDFEAITINNSISFIDTTKVGNVFYLDFYMGSYVKAEGKRYRKSTIDDYDIVAINGVDESDENKRTNTIIFKNNTNYNDTISPAEYNIALDTADNILGEEEIK